MITDGCLRINEYITIRLAPKLPPGYPDVSKGTPVSHHQHTQRRIPPKFERLDKIQQEAVLPAKLRRLKRRQRESQLAAVPVASGSLSTIPLKRKAEVDRADTPRLMIKIPASKRRALLVRHDLENAANNIPSETINSDVNYSQRKDEPVEVATVLLNLQAVSDREASQPRAAAAPQLLMPAHTSRSSTPL